MKRLYIYLTIFICCWIFFDIWWVLSYGFWNWQALPTLLSAVVAGCLADKIHRRLKERRIRKE